MTQIDAQKLGALAQTDRTGGATEGEAVFRVDDLSVSYSGNVALRGVSLDIFKNSVTAFIGPSGAVRARSSAASTG